MICKAEIGVFANNHDKSNCLKFNAMDIYFSLPSARCRARLWGDNGE